LKNINEDDAIEQLLKLIQHATLTPHTSHLLNNSTTASRSEADNLTTNSLTMSIEVKGITKLYGQQKALDNVSFYRRHGRDRRIHRSKRCWQVHHDEDHHGYIPQTEGTVLVNEMETLEHSLEIRKMIGYLPENNPFTLICMSGSTSKWWRGSTRKDRRVKRPAEKECRRRCGSGGLIALVGLEKRRTRRSGPVERVSPAGGIGAGADTRPVGADSR
jgi:hypothetical protein